MSTDVLIDIPFGYPAPPVLSPGIHETIAEGTPHWGDRLWDILYLSNTPGIKQLTPTTALFTVHLNPGSPDAYIEHFIRHDIDHIPHLSLLSEWNNHPRPHPAPPPSDHFQPRRHPRWRIRQR